MKGLEEINVEIHPASCLLFEYLLHAIIENFLNRNTVEVCSSGD